MEAILLIAEAAAAPGTTPAMPRDIELRARVSAREVRIELRAEPRLTDIAVERSHKTAII